MIGDFRRGRATLPALFALLAAIALRAHVPAAVDKSLFVAVLDAAGKPVKGVTIADLLIREDGQDREIIAVKPASQPISVVVLVDTAQGRRVTDAYGTPEEYTRDIRVAVAAFAKQLLSQSPDAAIMIMEFGGAAIPVVRFTTNPADLEKAVNRLVAKPGVGSVLMEAITAANVELTARPTPRRAIVTLNLEPSDEQSREDKRIVESFKKSGAQLWSVSVQRGNLRTSKRDVVINELARITGGRRDFIVGISALAAILKGYADALAGQYEVVYKRPESNRPTQILQTGTLLQNVRLHASGFAPR